MAAKQREELIQIIGWIVGVAFFVTGVAFIIYFSAKWAGKI